MKRSWAGEDRNVSLLMASAVNLEGFREILVGHHERDPALNPRGRRLPDGQSCSTLRDYGISPEKVVGQMLHKNSDTFRVRPHLPSKPGSGAALC